MILTKGKMYKVSCVSFFLLNIIVCLFHAKATLQACLRIIVLGTTPRSHVLHFRSFRDKSHGSEKIMYSVRFDYIKKKKKKNLVTLSVMNFFHASIFLFVSMEVCLEAEETDRFPIFHRRSTSLLRHKVRRDRITSTFTRHTIADVV